MDKQRHQRTKCIDYNGEQCYTSRNIIVDETSSWKTFESEKTRKDERGHLK